MNEHPSLSRRALLSSLSLSVGAIATTALAARAQNTSTNTTPMDAPAGAPSDLEILNFALGLELLELDFYTRAIEAQTARAFLKGRLAEVITTIRDHEAAHVEALRSAITGAGGTPVGAAASYSYPADVFISPVSFARYAVSLEEIGIGAYLGAAGKLKSRDLRRAAASIYGAETRHTAVLRHLGGHAFSVRYYESPLTVAEVQGLIAPIVGA
jgi:rubrerythrin